MVVLTASPPPTMVIATAGAPRRVAPTPAPRHPPLTSTSSPASMARHHRTSNAPVMLRLNRVNTRIHPLRASNTNTRAKTTATAPRLRSSTSSIPNQDNNIRATAKEQATDSKLDMEDQVIPLILDRPHKASMARTPLMVATRTTISTSTTSTVVLINSTHHLPSNTKAMVHLLASSSTVALLSLVGRILLVMGPVVLL